ncbi:MAG TPA: ATP-binding protein, partial [Thermoanaerobaculia bacterium]
IGSDIANDVPRQELARALANASAADDRWHQRGDGTTRFVSGMTMTVLREDAAVGFIKVVRDFTAKKEAERRLQAQTAAMRVLAEEHTIATAGPKFLAALADNLLWDAAALWLEDDSEQLRCVSTWTRPASKLAPLGSDFAMRTFRRGEGSVGQVWAGNAPLWVRNIADVDLPARREILEAHRIRSAFLFPIPTDGEATGVVELFSCDPRDRDHELLSVAATVGLLLGYFIVRERIERQLHDRDRAREYLLARVSHDLRSPLTTIRGWAQLLGTGADPETTRTAARMIDDAVSAQQSLVEELLDFARVTAGKLRFDREVVDLPSFVDDLVEAAQPAAIEAGLVLELHLETDRCAVIADRQRLRQIFGNLLSNAFKFTPKGGRVSVKVTREERDARIEVSDTGPGIPPELLPQIFERYKQADTAAAQAGLGLGLTIVAELVRMHGGTIVAMSDQTAGGATFVVTLPAER